METTYRETLAEGIGESIMPPGKWMLAGVFPILFASGDFLLLGAQLVEQHVRRAPAYIPEPMPRRIVEACNLFLLRHSDCPCCKCRFDRQSVGALRNSMIEWIRLRG